MAEVEQREAPPTTPMACNIRAHREAIRRHWLSASIELERFSQSPHATTKRIEAFRRTLIRDGIDCGADL